MIFLPWLVCIWQNCFPLSSLFQWQWGTLMRDNSKSLASRGQSKERDYAQHLETLLSCIWVLNQQRKWLRKPWETEWQCLLPLKWDTHEMCGCVKTMRRVSGVVTSLSVSDLLLRPRSLSLEECFSDEYRTLFKNKFELTCTCFL